MSRGQTKIGKIQFVMDERLSREKNSLLSRRLAMIKHFAEVQVLPASTTEDQMLLKLKEQSPQLVLAPWHRYLAWSRVEAFYGLTRTSGPTFAGYFCEPLLPHEIGETADHLRAILLDFSAPQTPDIAKLVAALLVDRRRTGLTPLVEGRTTIYYENWYSGQGLGHRMDAVMGIPEVALGPFASRGNAIRLCLGALWSLVYDSGPGKGDFSRNIGTSMPKAYFQIAADRRMLFLRLIYSAAGWSPKEVLASFWPRAKQPLSPVQVLHGAAESLRVHWIAESSDLEITVGFNAGLDAESSMEQLRTLWIEPVTTNIISEVPFEVSGPNAASLRPLPGLGQSSPSSGTPTGASRPGSLTGLSEEHQERLLIDAAGKIRDLKRLVAARDDQLRELRNGGVGTAPPLPPPDFEGLIDAFKARISDAGHELRQLEQQLSFISSTPDEGHRGAELEKLRARIAEATARQESWATKLAELIAQLRMIYPKGRKAG